VWLHGEGSLREVEGTKANPAAEPGRLKGCQARGPFARSQVKGERVRSANPDEPDYPSLVLPDRDASLTSAEPSRLVNPTVDGRCREPSST